MKILPLLLLSFALLIGCGKPNLDDPKTLDQILVEAIDEGELQERGKEGEELGYAPNSQTPYTGWVKGMYENGKVRYLLQVKDGKAHGLSTWWHDNGQKKGETNYKDGKEHGLETVWYENGQKELETNYKDGKEHGLMTGWHENGQKAGEGNLKDGKAHGLSIIWDENGNMIVQTKWENGVKVE